MSTSGNDPSPARPRPDRPGLFDRLRTLFGASSGSVREEIVDTLKEASPGEGITEQERVLLENVLSLHDLRVDDIMVPRADIVAVESEISLHDLLKVFRTAGHSRLPVYARTLDDPRGMVHIRDFVDHVAKAAETANLPIVRAARGTEERRRETTRFEAFDLSAPLSRTEILRPVLFAPPSMPALDLLVKMQTSRTHMALVIDEYGGTDGLVSIEDIVEKIVGDIEDEHDLEEKPRIEATAEGGWVIDARADLGDFSAALGRDLGAGVDSDEIDTVAGFIMMLTGRVPVRGEIVRVDDGLEFEVLDADPRRVRRVKARLLAPPDPSV